MTTQLEDVSSNVAQDHISNQRLRNEAIRKGMGSQWQPSSNVSTNTSPTWYDTSTNYEGGNSTLASTYSKLKNNFDNLTSNYTTDASEGVTNFGNNDKAPSWASGAVDTGLRAAGLGNYAGLGSAAFSLSQGNKPAAIGTLASTLTNLATQGKIPGLPGVVGNLAGGIAADKPTADIGIGIGSSLLGTVLSKVNPYVGLAYGISRLTGFNPLESLYNWWDGTTAQDRQAMNFPWDYESDPTDSWSNWRESKDEDFQGRKTFAEELDKLENDYNDRSTTNTPGGYKGPKVDEEDDNDRDSGNNNSGSTSGSRYHKYRDEETEAYDGDEDSDDGDE